MSAAPPSPSRLFADDTPAMDLLCAAAGVTPPFPPPPRAGDSDATDWESLLGYCHGVTRPAVTATCDALGRDGDAARPALSALAVALHLMERLRDAKRDWTGGRTLFLPAAWFDAATISPDRLASPTACGQTRAVLDRALDGVDHLLVEAAPLPRLVADSRQRRRLALLLCLARCMARHLRRRDPLDRRLRLAARHRLSCRLAALIFPAGS